jgi:hypothetical protein
MRLRKTVCTIVLVMFLVGMLPIAVAQPPNEKGKALAEKYKKSKQEYAKALKMYKNARKEYRAAMAKFRKTKKKEDSKVALYRAKAFLLKADIAMTRYLKMLRAKVEHTRGLDDAKKADFLAEIDGYIQWLEQQEEAIDSAQSMEELRSTATEIREKWREIRVAAKKISGHVLVGKTDTIISRAESLAAKIEDKIPEMQERGIDTAELEDWLADFKEKIELAKELNAAAEEKFDQISGPENAAALFREGHALIKEAHKNIRHAYKDLKKIMKSYKRHVRGTEKGVVVSGSGRLTAQGDGRAYLHGSGTITLSAVNGTMIVSGNASVDISGGNVTDLGDGRVKYHGFHSALVTGQQITVQISGHGIDLVVEGTGKAVLTGKGTYSVCGKRCLEGDAEPRTGTWTASGVSITMTSEEEAG